MEAASKHVPAPPLVGDDVVTYCLMTQPSLISYQVRTRQEPVVFFFIFGGRSERLGREIEVFFFPSCSSHLKLTNKQKKMLAHKIKLIGAATPLTV